MKTNAPKNEERDEFNGVKVKIVNLGQFGFARTNMYDEKKNLLYYRIKEISKKSLIDEKIPRREYISDGKILIRRYVGKKDKDFKDNNFIEFCRKLKEAKSVPQGPDYYRAAGELGISVRTAIKYAGCYELFFKKSK